MLYAATRRAQLWNIFVVAAVSIYTCMYTIETYVSNNREWQSRRQQEQVLSKKESQNHLLPFPPNFAWQSLRNGTFNDKASSDYGTVQTNVFPETEPFPRWKGSIGVDELNRAINLSMSGKLRFDRVHRIYVVSDSGIMYHVNTPRPEDADQAPYRRARTMEIFALDVLAHVKMTRNDDNEKYRYLSAILGEGGFAYIANYADSKFCADQQPFVDENSVPLLNSNDSIVPVFTLSSPVNCHRAFPTPTYETIEQATSDWSTLIPYYRKKYNRSNQLRKAVWRGGPTGDRFPYRNARIRLCMSASDRPDILDVKLTKRRKQWNNSGESGIISVRGNPSSGNQTITAFDDSQFLGTKLAMDDFQNYRAIIDVDGHSWSSRFGKLMCYSSVVLKVEPDDVDYFHPQLRPWVHYIPVHSNLSNLYDSVSFAISDDPTISSVIQNANDWCLQHLNRPSLIRDLAHIWDRYSYHLLLHSWNETIGEKISDKPDVIESSSSYGIKWRKHRQELFHSFNFTPLYEK